MFHFSVLVFNDQFDKFAKKMIQRLQSLFLLLAALSFGLEYAFPFAASDAPVTGLFGDGIYNINDHIALQGLTIAGALLCLFIITLYKNRSLQLRLGYLAITIAILLPVIAVLIYSNQTAGLEDANISDRAGLYLPIGMILFVGLALRFIRKDEKLVRSMDRLR